MAILGAIVLTILVGAVAPVLWLRHLWKRQNTLPRWTKAAGILVALPLLLGALSTLRGLVGMFGVVGTESIDPSELARILTEVMFLALNPTALGLLVWLPGVLVLSLLTRDSLRRSE